MGLDLCEALLCIRLHIQVINQLNLLLNVILYVHMTATESIH